MALPRPALIALLGGVLILALFALTRVAGQADDSTDDPAAPAAAVEAPTSGGSEPGPADRPTSAKPAASGIPAGLERAIERGRVAVVVFTQDGGAEDAAVRAAVRSLRGVPVFVDDVRDIADYQPVVGELDIDRAPAVVVVGKDAKAQVIEGYVDAGSLRQLVEDAR